MTIDSVPVAVLPAGIRAHVADAVVDGGGQLVDVADARMLVWTDPSDPAALGDVMRTADHLEAVQLLWAGVEGFVSAGVIDRDRVWACGKGVYAEEVAEHALTLILAGLRELPTRVQATSWGQRTGTSLIGRRITILGGGGITEALVRFLAPFDATITVVRRTPSAMPGVARVVSADDTIAAVADADVVVLALALTDETRGVVDAAFLDAMQGHAWLINVARGEHVVTADLVAALEDGIIAGAGLDVTDPEPLPDGHPLWDLRTAIITPHAANTEEMAVPVVQRRVRENVRRFAEGLPLVGLVDLDVGY